MVSDEKSKLKIAYFAAGCFWGVEERFRVLKGVKDTVVGYMGGDKKNPSYEEVKTSKTGYAETVQVEYDSEIISYEELLEVFWESHDPTTLNRQGLDMGTQYRSVIFYHTAEQEEVARVSKDRLEESGKYERPIVTEVVLASVFYEAEEYHQKYLKQRGLKTC